MSNKPAREFLDSMEESQDALRQSISKSRHLAAEADRLIQRHRGEAGSSAEDTSDSPAWAPESRESGDPEKQPDQ
jgi:hypothetical protein